MNPPHQSEHHVRHYKHPRHPASKCVTDLSLMILVGSLLQGACMAWHGGWWGAVTFVPSASRPGPEHLVAELARQIAPFQLNVSRILLNSYSRACLWNGTGFYGAALIRHLLAGAVIRRSVIDRLL